LPGRTAVLQRRFLVWLNSTGKPEALEMPEPFEPRKRVQSCPSAADARRRKAGNRKWRHFIGGLRLDLYRILFAAEAGYEMTPEQRIRRSARFTPERG
jgi:hypothetical protein